MSELKRGTPTILVVEDSADTCTVIRMEQERWGYRVVEAADGREAYILKPLDMPQLEKTVSGFIYG